MSKCLYEKQALQSNFYTTFLENCDKGLWIPHVLKLCLGASNATLSINTFTTKKF